MSYVTLFLTLRCESVFKLEMYVLELINRSKSLGLRMVPLGFLVRVASVGTFQRPTGHCGSSFNKIIVMEFSQLHN